MTTTKIIYKIAKSDADYAQVYQVRKKIYCEIFHYPKKLIDVEKGANHRHILAIKNDIPVGTISMASADTTGKFAIEKYHDISKYKNARNTELTKLAVIEPKINILTAASMIGIAYHTLKTDNCENIFIATPQLYYNVNLYKKFGYKIIGEALYENIFHVYIMHTTISSFEKKLSNRNKIRFAEKKYFEVIN